MMEIPKEKGLFPEILHELLEETEKNGESDIISWSSEGLCFKVHKKDEFVDSVLSRYFRLSQYKSFIRQINLWGFNCITDGKHKGYYQHQKFIRGKKELCNGMFREKIKGIRKRGRNPLKDNTILTDGPAPTNSNTLIPDVSPALSSGTSATALSTNSMISRGRAMSQSDESLLLGYAASPFLSMKQQQQHPSPDFYSLGSSQQQQQHQGQQLSQTSPATDLRYAMPSSSSNPLFYPPAAAPSAAAGLTTSSLPPSVLPISECLSMALDSSTSHNSSPAMRSSSGFFLSPAQQSQQQMMLHQAYYTAAVNTNTTPTTGGEVASSLGHHHAGSNQNAQAFQTLPSNQRQLLPLTMGATPGRHDDYNRVGELMSSQQQGLQQPIQPGLLPMASASTMMRASPPAGLDGGWAGGGPYNMNPSHFFPDSDHNIMTTASAANNNNNMNNNNGGEDWFSALERNFEVPQGAVTRARMGSPTSAGSDYTANVIIGNNNGIRGVVDEDASKRMIIADGVTNNSSYSGNHTTIITTDDILEPRPFSQHQW